MKTYLVKISFLIVMVFTYLFYSHSRSWKYLPETKQEETYIFVVNHGWHTGLILIQENLGEDLEFLNDHFGQNPFYEIGWGDKGFYEADEITINLALKALFLPTPSVLHIVALPYTPEKYFAGSELVKLNLSKKAHQILNQRISETFQRDTGGNLIRTRPGIYGKSSFYSANGFYFFANTCNTWIARILEEAGLPFQSFLTLTARGVMNQAKESMTFYECCSKESKEQK